MTHTLPQSMYRYETWPEREDLLAVLTQQVEIL